MCKTDGLGKATGRYNIGIKWNNIKNLCLGHLCASLAISHFSAVSIAKSYSNGCFLLMCVGETGKTKQSRNVVFSSKSETYYKDT